MSRIVQLMFPPGSWAGEEWLRRHEPVIECSYMTDFRPKRVGYHKKPDPPLPEWWGKPTILIKGVIVPPP